jgi:hypothetical protein
MQESLRLGIALLVLLLTSLQSPAQDKPRLSRDQVSKIESLIQTEMSQSKIPVSRSQS